MTSGVLRDITNIKIARLAKQQSQFEKAKASLLDRAKDSPDSLSILVKGFKELGVDGKTIDASLHNIRLFQYQAKYDASISESLIQDCENELVSALDARSKRFEFSALYARLVTEWADNPNDTKALLETIASVSDTNNADVSEGYEPIGREEMYNQRREWESYVFSELQTDPAAIHRYLGDVFFKITKAKRAGKTPLEDLREYMGSFGVDMQGRPALKRCTESDVRFCVKGVLQADLFTGKKRDALLGLGDAHAPILKEIADVINGETSTLGLWQWQPSPIPVHMRRQLNGKYRVYMDSEIHQALLVHWIGVHFAIHLKDAFSMFFQSGAWIQSSHVSMTRQDRVRRKFYVPNETTRSVRNCRRETFQDDFFTTQLPSSISEGIREYDCERDQPSEKKSPLEVKQSLLHIATTEMLLQKKLYGKFTLVQTDFKWFGPSLPHSTIFAVLRFLHVPTYWIDFFGKFLAMPLVFPDDGPQAAVRTRKRGVPISQVLADALGEMVLFCLDFAVNKATRGSIELYRFHDDVWFWGQEDSCLAAWQAVTSFAKCMGLELNEKKTGSFTVTNASTQNMTPLIGLPIGPVRWGFLLFDSSQSRWTIDMDCINEHITELRHQLVACRSIACWIQAWNSYVSRFFSNNFGKAANCLGKEHLDMAFSAFEHIQCELFTSLDDDDNGCKDVTSYVKKMIRTRFGISDIPDSFLAFPIEYGGLDVRNPFIPLLAIYNKSVENPASRLDTAFERDEEHYEKAKQAFEVAEHIDIPAECDPDVFFSFEEYTRFREETSTPLYKAYVESLKIPVVNGIELTDALTIAALDLPADLQYAKNLFDDPYRAWVVSLYAKEAVSTFGGLVLGEREMLPIELVKLLRGEKVRWAT